MSAGTTEKDKKTLLHLDPRTKLLMLAAFSVIVMIDVKNGPAYYVRVVLTFIPVILACLEGKIHIGAWFTTLFVLATAVKSFSQTYIGGSIGMLILFLCYMVTQFAPTMIMVWYCISTTKISELMAAMSRMHSPQGVSISIAVMMRFFPTLGEEYRSIRDAMKMRGIQLGGGKPEKMIEYRIIPLLFSTVNIGDELSAAAITRGLGAPVKRTNVCEIGFHNLDLILIAATILLSGLYLFFSLGGGNIIL